MKTCSVTPLLLLATMSLGACGGGGGGGVGTASGDVAPRPAAFSSTQIAEIAAYAANAEDGGSPAGGGAIDNAQFTDFSRRAIVDGNEAVVDFTRFRDTNQGVVRIDDGTGAARYAIIGEGGAQVVSSGSFSGRIEADFQMASGAPIQSSQGSFNATLDMATGELAYGGTVTGETRYIDIFGDATVGPDGTFNAEDGALVRIRNNDNGSLVGSATGDTAGYTARSGGSDVLLGTVDAANSDGFRMEGAFAASK